MKMKMKMKTKNRPTNNQHEVARRRRNWAIFLGVIFLALLFFIMTILRTQY